MEKNDPVGEQDAKTIDSISNQHVPADDQKVEEWKPTNKSIIDVVRSRKYRRALIAVAGTMMAQQLCGINSVVMYSVAILGKIMPNQAGLVTVIVAVLSYFLLYDFPETASFLTEEERAFVVYRLKYQGQVASKTTTDDAAVARVAQSEECQWKYVWQAFTDWQIYVNIFVYWGVSRPFHCAVHYRLCD